VELVVFFAALFFADLVCCSFSMLRSTGGAKGPFSERHKGAAYCSFDGGKYEFEGKLRNEQSWGVAVKADLGDIMLKGCPTGNDAEWRWSGRAGGYNMEES
jgi:hypothetical protein